MIAAALAFAAGVVFAFGLMWLVHWLLFAPIKPEHEPYDPCGWR